MDIHLVGIGGGGMCGLAAMLQRFGARVSGSDQVAFEGVGPLVAAGASVWIGHRPELMDPRLDLVVTSAAVPETNAELVAARARGLPVLKYAEMIGRVMATQGRGIAVAGTHGKSTTTAMCVHLCRSAGLDPSFLFGATSAQLGGGSHVGTGEPFIVEACEFDRSFLHLRPESAAILNIEPDHLDCYRDLDDITDAFRDFARFVAPEGLIVYQEGNPATERAASAAAAAKQSFGFGEQADWRALNLRHTRGCFSFVIQFRGSPVITSSLSIPGRYNVSNALAAVALAYHAGADFESMAASLPRFEGIARRMALRGEGRGVTILDDYAHHPTEIRVTLEAARSRYSPKRTLVVFQPHQHSRTRLLLNEFAQSLSGVDEVFIPDVYTARSVAPSLGHNGSTEAGDAAASAAGHATGEDAGRDAAEPIGSRALVSRLRDAGASARYVPELNDVAHRVAEDLREGDLVMTMGAGDVWKVADELVARIC